MKKLLAMIVAAIMVLSLSAVVFADEANGSITISNAVVGQTYTVYKMADLESYVDGENYSYKIVEEWVDFFTDGAYKDKFTVDNGYILGTTLEDADMARFAKDALAYAAANSISAVATDVAEAAKEGDITATLIFGGLELGYYLVDTTLGTICSINTTDTNADIEEKNDIPGIIKEVKEDSTEEWSETNHADIGQTVEFKSTIETRTGAQLYILHDRMSSGLTFKSVTSVKLFTKTGVDESGEPEYDEDAGTVIDAENYVIYTAPEAEGGADGRRHDDCTFEVAFTQEFCDTLTDDKLIVVEYDAVLNEDAVIAGEGNPNDVSLTYGENSNYETLPDRTITYTFEFDLVKTDTEKKLLDGAEFKLYVKGGSEAFKLVLLDDGTYRVATADDEETTDIIVVKNGKAVVSGLDSGNYELEETKAPKGYNKLTARVGFEIVDTNVKASFENEDTYKDGGVQVINKTGVELPSTGGKGTLIFTVVGLCLVVGAGVLLVTKKRMSKISD